MFNLLTLASCGLDVYISKNAEIKRPHLAKMGNHVAIDSFVYCTTRLEIGDHVHISPAVTVIGGEHSLFKIGNFCTVAAGCRIICSSDTFSGNGLVTAPGIPGEFTERVLGTIVMENYSSLATNVIVCPGVVIEEGAVVGANSLVTKYIPAWEVCAGSPARKIKDRPREKMMEYARRLGYE